MIIPGSLVTYTLVLSNTGTGSVLQTILTDTLPAGVTFGGFVADGGAIEADGTISWAGNLPVDADVTVIFTATVDMDYNLYGETITNTVEYASPAAGNGSASAAFIVSEGEAILSITKTVETSHAPVKPGDPITYTLVVRNDGNVDAVGVHIWDTLPEGVIGDDVNITTTIAAGTAYTITIPATLALDVLPGSIIVNTAHYQSGLLNGEATASFTVAVINKVWLPLLRR